MGCSEQIFTMEQYIVKRILGRLLLATTLLSPLFVSAESDKHYRIQLETVDGEKVVPVATLEMSAQQGGWDYRLGMVEDGFGDYFLSMRPFKCITNRTDMLCHLQYPYNIKRKISQSDLTDLEYDLLFIRRKPTDYGINPWNGLYYRLQWQGDLLIGEAHEVDLDLLAVPPDEGVLRPIQEHDLHQIDAEQLWLPRLVARPVD